MASPPSLFCCMFFIVSIAATNSPVEPSKEFKVGGSEGWRTPDANESAIYDQWAARKRFRVGDSLRFEYKNDSVLVVDKFGYYHCNASNPISTFNHGNTTVVNLDKPGPIYFISGDPNHCKDGQRLVIEVMSLHQVAHSPPSVANSPDSAMSPSSLSGSGVSDSVTLVSVSVAVIATSVTLFSAPFPFVSYV
ncbi:hypothetical protein RHMOL_Rhmol08G0300900 [Rhododendron molle]|uniref:Uncharacterized protein n=1 Tax=Rhododendron molle TaxID=49168 RepID=A0ACC0MTV8_RHOML|nr:hypothetical protein RHMOL_Rhmol08G0300900 [Rhododendron molle]